MATTTAKWKPNPELVELLKNPPKPVCGLGKILAEHPDGKAIEKAIGNEKWSAAQLANVLAKQLATPLSSNAVSKHRNGECLCYTN